ncbi:MAG: hypothetical protein EAZ93_17935 [Oscillatoriales cyanobacterium]|nr:MAG: hypothetical protein EAZ93_17935 [Oscillatoriales cyanobacterium]
MKYLSHFGDFVNGNSIEKTEAIDRRASAKPGLINLESIPNRKSKILSSPEFIRGVASKI